jgi:hypothetical protein
MLNDEVDFIPTLDMPVRKTRAGPFCVENRGLILRHVVVLGSCLSIEFDLITGFTCHDAWLANSELSQFVFGNAG